MIQANKVIFSDKVSLYPQNKSKRAKEMMSIFFDSARKLIILEKFV